MAKVKHNLGIIRSSLALDHNLLEKFPDLSKDDNSSLLKIYSILPTPSFTDENGNGHVETSQIVDSKTNQGGWFYIRNSGEIYANLPNGAYTKDQEYEIWNDEIENNTGNNIADNTDGDNAEDSSGNTNLNWWEL